jgi:hypothetical protein
VRACVLFVYLHVSLLIIMFLGCLRPLIVHDSWRNVNDCYGKITTFTSNICIESSDAVQHPRVGRVFIKVIKNEQEILRLYEETQARRGEDIAYSLRREVDFSSRNCSRGIEVSYNGNFSSDGGILDVDYSWARSCTYARRVSKIAPHGVGSKGVDFSEKNIRSLIDAGNGVYAFIPWNSDRGRIIRGHGKGILVKFEGFMYQKKGSFYKVTPVI